MIINYHRFASILKDHILSQKMNDSISIDSTIAVSINALKSATLPAHLIPLL